MLESVYVYHSKSFWCMRLYISSMLSANGRHGREQGHKSCSGPTLRDCARNLSNHHVNFIVSPCHKNHETREYHQVVTSSIPDAFIRHACFSRCNHNLHHNPSLSLPHECILLRCSTSCCNSTLTSSVSCSSGSPSTSTIIGARRGVSRWTVASWSRYNCTIIFHTGSFS